MPLLPLYFAVVTGLQHYVVVKSLYKDPRSFVKNFLGVTVGSLFLHLVILCLWAFTHMTTARTFIIAFCICYIVYLAFETIQLVLLVRRKRNE
jgi:threonine/homoserine/homoserine lactone efflux protein